MPNDNKKDSSKGGKGGDSDQGRGFSSKGIPTKDAVAATSGMASEADPSEVSDTSAP